MATAHGHSTAMALTTIIVHMCFTMGCGLDAVNSVFGLTPHHPKANVSAADGMGDYDWVFQITIKSEAMLCLDLSGGRAVNGNTVDIWECNGLENQLWYFKDWKIAYAGNPDKCIDAGTMQGGNKLMIWDCNGQNQQKWGYDANMGTIYLAASEADASLCMDLSGGSKTHGTQVQIWECSQEWMQQWNLQAGITIRIGENTNMCLDASNGGQSKGDAIQLWGCNGHANQYWIFKSGSNQIKSALDTSLCIDAGDMKPGTKLMLWDCNGLSQQKWGYDFKQGTIYLAESEMDASICVDISGGSLSQGTQMEVWGCNGCWNQDIQLYGPPSDGAMLGASSSYGNPASSQYVLGSNFQRPVASGARGNCPPKPGPGPSPGPAPPGPPGPAPPPPPPGPAPGPALQMRSWCDEHQASMNWPKFTSQSQLQGDPKWSKYFTSVYGGVPSSGYPICVNGMYYVYKPALDNAGISGSGLKTHSQEFGGKIYVVQHGTAKAFSSNTWVEGLHCRTGAETHSAWYWYYPGSGIWIWSGKTDVFQHRAEAEKKYLGTTHCSGFECGGKLFTTAKSKFGIDTVQYTAERDGNTFMWIVCMGVGRNTCGASSCQWKAGWGASKTCNCDQSSRCQNCKGFGLLGDGSNTSATPCDVIV